LSQEKLVPTCHFSDFKLTYEQAIKSKKLIYEPATQRDGKEGESSSSNSESSDTNDGLVAGASEGHQESRQRLLEKLRKNQTHKISTTAFDTTFGVKNVSDIKVVQKLMDTKVKQKRGSVGVAVAQECPFCNETIPADTKYVDPITQRDNKRHWEVCAGLQLARGDPLLALQQKCDLLNQQQAPVSSGLSANRKRSYQENYELPGEIDLDDLKCIKMAKVQKLNLRYKSIDRGRLSDSRGLGDS